MGMLQTSFATPRLSRTLRALAEFCQWLEKELR